MNIITLIRKTDGIEFQGFLDWDGLSRQMNFYYYDEEKDGWTSDKLGNFKPVPLLPKATGVLCETGTTESSAYEQKVIGE
jgi:hypothetical protein